MIHDRRGWTVIELMVAVGILGFVISIGALAQTRLLPNYRLSAATRQVVTDLRLLRAKAIAQNNRFKLVFAANSNSYHAERRNPDSGAWEPYALYGRTSGTEASTQSVDLPTSVTATGAIEVTFDPRGTVSITSGTPPLTLSVPGPRTRSLSINLAGLITIS